MAKNYNREIEAIRARAAEIQKRIVYARIDKFQELYASADSCAVKTVIFRGLEEIVHKIEQTGAET